MKQYIISEEELKEFGYQLFKNVNRIMRLHVDDFLKSKQSVELVAEGKIVYEGKDAWIKSPDIKGIDPKPLFKNYENQNIKIFIAKDAK